ncbi:cadherin repeat domain-containing protein, partial [Grimontia sp. S25]
MISISPEGQYRVVNGEDVASPGELIIAFHDTTVTAMPGSDAYPGLGSTATMFYIGDFGAVPLFESRATENIDLILSETFPNAGISSVMTLARGTSNTDDTEQDELRDHTQVPLSVIEGCLSHGMALGDMAGFDTTGLAAELSPLQAELLSKMFPLADLVDVDDSDNVISENAQIGDEVGIHIAKEFDDGHGDVTYTLTDDAGGLFAIDPETGIVTVAGNLDYETATQYTIEVSATSEDNQVKTQTFTINIADNAPEEGDTDRSVSDVTAGAQGIVSESIANGTSTGLTVTASDEDGDKVTFTLVDNAGGAFAIDSETGEVTVADSSLLDYESAQTQTIVVEATSIDGSTSTQSFTISLTDDNSEFSVTSITDSDAGANMVSESAAIGTSVGLQLTASDGDLTDTISFSLSDDAGGLFAIDPVTGEVTVAGALDYETATSHDITVVAASTDGTTSAQTYTIQLTDDTTEHSASAVTETDATANEVSESATVGSSVGVTFHSQDDDGTDTVSYSLTDDAGGLFTIDASTGEVTLAGSLDRETASQHTITVLATSTDGSTSTQTLTVDVLDDTSEFSVTAVADGDGTANSVSENAAVGTAVGITVNAGDSDATDTVSFSLSDDAGGLFAIDPVTGEVTVAGVLDYETATSHDITVVATSTDGTTSAHTYTIHLTDDTSEHSASAVTETDATANQISESATVGSSVGVTFHSQDDDGTDTVSYSLTDDAGGLFTIDTSTGEVTLAGSLDRETASQHTITVLATSTDGSTSTQTLTIDVLDDTSEFSVTAVADGDGTANSVSENAVVGSTVGITVNAGDSDATDTVSYSLTDSAGGLFAIDSATGVVTVAGNLDYETAQQHTITVQATSTDGTTSTQTFTIDVTNVDAATGDTDASVGSMTDTDAGLNQVSDTATVGSTVGIDISAVDADGDNITYSLSNSAGGLFTIDASTGVVTLAGGVSALTDTTQTITVVATSSDGSTSTADFDINVIDGGIGELTDIDAMQNLVGDSSNGYTYLRAQAVDGDGDAVTYSLSDSHGGAFSINSSTGQVYVANHNLLNA